MLFLLMSIFHRERWFFLLEIYDKQNYTDNKAIILHFQLFFMTRAFFLIIAQKGLSQWERVLHM